MPLLTGRNTAKVCASNGIWDVGDNEQPTKCVIITKTRERTTHDRISATLQSDCGAHSNYPLAAGRIASVRTFRACSADNCAHPVADLYRRIYNAMAYMFPSICQLHRPAQKWIRLGRTGKFSLTKHGLQRDRFPLAIHAGSFSCHQRLHQAKELDAARATFRLASCRCQSVRHWGASSPGVVLTSAS